MSHLLRALPSPQNTLAFHRWYPLAYGETEAQNHGSKDTLRNVTRVPWVGEAWEFPLQPQPHGLLGPG